MAIEILPLPLPPSADPSKFKDFGREVKGIHPGRLTDEEFKEVEQLLYKVCISQVLSISSCLLPVCSEAWRAALQKYRSLTRGAVQAHEGVSDTDIIILVTVFSP